MRRLTSRATSRPTNRLTNRLTNGLTQRQRLAAVVLVVVAGCFIALDLTGGSLRDAHSGARGLLGSLYRGSDTVLGPTRRFVQGVPAAGTNADRVAALQRENASLRGQLADASADNATAADLAKLQLAAGTGGFKIVPSRVVAFGPGQGFDWTATIDIGASSGVAVNQTVTSAAGLVGRVLHVDAGTAVVLLAADPGSGVGVRDVRNNQLGLATGAGNAGYTLSPLDPNADLQVGDQLVTGPAGSSSFAVGLALGTISAVTTNADGARTATVRSAIVPTAIALVGVIVSDGSSSAPRSVITGSVSP